MGQHLIFYIIGFLVALILSNIINRVFPKIPLPFIQVVFGFIIPFLTGGEQIEFEPEIFLAFVIGPLLFREGEEADVPSILKHWLTVFILVLPVVIITTVVIGYVAHSFYPAIPLAACFAIGASLGPTDAVAVASLATRFNFPKRIINILSGEGLLNDASGIISFQFAILALTTGQFSVASASYQFLISAFGGALIGFIISWINNTLLSLLEDVAAQDVVGYLLLELIMPLVAFAAAEVFHVSEIIAVVVAGVMQAASFKKITLFDAQVSKVSHTVWNTITFVLNGLVFMILGLELEYITVPILHNSYYDNLSLISIILVITFVLFATRFIVLAIYYKFISIDRKQSFKRYMSDIKLLTFSGVKGTVSIATILLLPHAVAQEYPLMVFTTTGVTLFSFLTGIIILPIIAEKKPREAGGRARISILTDVVLELEKELEASKVKAGYYSVIDNYTGRIQHLIIKEESEDATQDFNNLRLLILRIEEDSLERAFASDDISLMTYRIYHRYLKELERGIAHSVVSSLAFAIAVLLRVIPLTITRILNIGKKGNHQSKYNLTEEVQSELNDLYLGNTELVLNALNNLKGVYDQVLLDLLKGNRIRIAELVANGEFAIRLIPHYRPNNIDEMTRGYYLERKIIAEYEDAGLITNRQARDMRKNVNTLEDYSMDENYSSLLYEFLEFRGGK